MASGNRRRSRSLTLQWHQNTSVPRAANLSHWDVTAVDGVTRRNSGPIIESPRSFGLSSRRKKRTRDSRHYPSAEANEYGAPKARLPSRCLRQTLTQSTTRAAEHRPVPGTLDVDPIQNRPKKRGTAWAGQTGCLRGWRPKCYRRRSRGSALTRLQGREGG